MGRVGLSVCLAALAFAWTWSATAGPMDVANTLRTKGCERRAPAKPALTRDSKTDQIAKAWSKGGRLGEHIPQGYGQARFASVFVDGATTDAQFEKALRSQLCEELTTPEFTRIGIHTQGKQTWIVLSSAADSPLQKDARKIRERALQLVNDARRKPRRCGARGFDPAAPLVLNDVLNTAAAGHAMNMAKHGKLQHEGFDGSTPAQRVTAAGYRWRTTGENIAAGMTTADAVVAGWLESPNHCTNIMNPNFREMGISFAEDAARNSGVYWVQVFGTSR